MKRWKCEIRKRMIVEAPSWLEAKQKFINIVSELELEPRAKLVTQQNKINHVNKLKNKK
jgi:hypothetical protein